MNVYCLMNEDNELVSIYRKREDADKERLAMKEYGWRVVARWVL